MCEHGQGYPVEVKAGNRGIAHVCTLIMHTSFAQMLRRPLQWSESCSEEPLGTDYAVRGDAGIVVPRCANCDLMVVSLDLVGLRSLEDVHHHNR